MSVATDRSVVCSPAALVAAAACASGLASMAQAQWTVINLHPAGAVSSEARAVHGAQQVGVTGTSQGAILWHGSAGSALHLEPAGSGSSVATGVFAGKQGGSIGVGTGVNARTHAAVWSGSAPSLVDLHPGAAVAVHSMIAGVAQTTQVGSFLAPDDGGGTFSSGRPCMWSGTASSFVDLTPAGYATGEARGAFGDQQVGATFDNFLGTACMWYGSAETFQNLQPEEALFSAAQCTDGVHQYGVIGILEPIPGLFPVRWSGTAESFEVLGIPEPETHWGEVHAVDAGFAVGYVTDNDGVTNSRACVWTGANGDYADIHSNLPAGLTDSNALGVWRHAESGTTYIVGYATNVATTQREAVMWVNGQGTNLITSAAAPADGSAAVGQPMVYTVRVLNAGPVASGPVTLTLTLPPTGVAGFAGATPAPSSVVGSQATFTLPSLAGSGAFTDVTVTLTAAAHGAVASVTAAASSATEADPTNNSDTVSSRIAGEPCVADMGMQGGLAGQDGVLDNNDFVAFIDLFFNQDARADVGAQGGLAGHDGAFDNNDFVVFIDLFFTGC